MRIAYLDCFSGISGDMFLGALLDAGVPLDLFQRTVAALDVGARLEVSRVNRAGIAAIKLDVIVNGERDRPREEFWAQRHDHGHAHAAPLAAPPAGPTWQPGDHGHAHEEGFALPGGHKHSHVHVHTHLHIHSDGSTHTHEHSHEHTHHHDHTGPHRHKHGDSQSHAHHPEADFIRIPVHHHTHEAANPQPELETPSQEQEQEAPEARTLGEILRIIAVAPISERARQMASEMFTLLGQAEAKVHNIDLQSVHFHETGAADAIVDIVCAAVGADILGVDRFISSPLNVGGGTVECAHGVLPVPAPATIELLKDAPIYSGDIQKELVTPTGAAIVKVLVSSFEDRPMMSTERVGYGAGSRDFPGHANVLRITIGDTHQQAILADLAGAASVVAPNLNAVPNPSAVPNLSTAQEEQIAILEANLDDLNPQLIGYIVDLALAQGALDVFTTPIQMKKNRPGTALTILAKLDDEEKMRVLLFRESSTLGVRVRRETRYVLRRRHESVHTPWGEIRMKIGSLDGHDSQYAPEYEDCRRIASERHIPLKTVMQEAIRLYLDQKHG